MRKQLFIALCNSLKAILDKDENRKIKHIDLWNHNVEFIEMETPFEFPAVFIEFTPIQWELLKDKSYRSRATVNLHVVTRWEGSAAEGSSYQGDALAVFDLIDDINKVLTGLSGTGFHAMYRSASTTNHNHDDILENIESYSVVFEDNTCVI